MLKSRACLNCRRRKIKCDLIKPACDQCVRSRGLFKDCEYLGDGPTETQLLEERISFLQNRIQELENPSPSILPIHLHLNNLMNPNFCSSHDTLTQFHEPPPDIARLLANAFYHHCLHFGFFLDIRRSQASFLLQVPIGHHARPSAALINAIYLWGTHLTPSVAGTYDQGVFLRNTLCCLTSDLTSSHPNRVLHGIQAEILLSYYYLKNGKVLEGTYHANAAVSLLISAGFHGIHKTGHSNAFNHRPPDPAILLPVDAIEEGERIHAFWAVFILNNYWAIIQESHAMFYDLRKIGAHTPWPMSTAGSELYSLPNESCDTVKSLINTSTEEVPCIALHAKATVLLAQTVMLQPHQGSTLQPNVLICLLDFLVNQFKSNFPPCSGTQGTRLTAHMMAHVATIKLHQPFSDINEDSRNKSLSAAQSIANLTNDMSSMGYIQTDPIMGILWTSACEVFMQEISRRAANYAQWTTPLQIILIQMAKFSSHSVLMELLVTRLQKNYATIMSM